MSMTLYAAPMSSATPVVNFLKELQVPCEIIMLDLAKGDQKQPEYLALNPNGKVPTLVVEGTPLFEALAIMQYLGDRFGVERGLWPAFGTSERLEALAWTTWAYVTAGATIQRLNHAQSKEVAPELHHPGQAEAAQAQLQELLAILDARLERHPYLLGEAFSLVDVVVGSMMTYATYCGVPTNAHPRVEAWLARFHARPAFLATWS